MRARAGESRSVLFPCPFFLRKGLPLAVLFLTNQRRPTFRLRIEPELVRQRAFLGIEPEFDAEQVRIKSATTDTRVVAPENVYPVTNIAFCGVIKSDEHERFVFRCFFARAVMELNELVLQHPLAAHGAFNRAAVAHFSGNTPVADKIIEKRILQFRCWASDKRCDGDEEQQENGRS